MTLTSVAAAIFTILLFPDRPLLRSISIGVSSGLLIGTPVLLWMPFGLEAGFARRLKRLPLLAYLAVNGAVMAAMLWFGHLAAHHLIWPPRGGFLEDPNLPASLVFSVALVIMVSIAVELRRLIGPGVFGAVLVGRYRYPRAERRLFLLLDVVGSTGLAERLGPERFLVPAMPEA